MTNTKAIPPDSTGSGARPWLGATSVLALIAAMTGPAAPAIGAPSAGDAYVYQLVNGYNKEIKGKIHYQVDQADADRITVSVSPDNAEAGWEHTAAYTKEGNWLRNLVESHGVPAEYHFATAYPAYVFPLDPGKSWSVRVNATVPGTDTPRRSVRVDGQVIGNERIRVPAGEFDTIKVKRIVYTGDIDYFRTETRVIEFDWYVPALGRPVRTERKSEWLDLSQCRRGGCDFRGNWDVLELIETRAAKR